MALRRHHPLVEFSRMENAFDRYLDRFFLDFFPVTWKGTRLPEASWTPVIDFIDKKTHFLLRVDLPGLKREDVNVSISDDNLLTIRGEIKRSEEQKKEDYYRCERRYGQFSRALELPQEVIPEKVEAALNDGILEIKLPKSKAKQPKELEVKVK